MKEKEFINIIKNTLNSNYIGDDCAYLKEYGITVTQDSLVENVHFSLKYMTPYQLGYKSVAVNISDICASGAEPQYLTIALSLPSYTNNDFIQQFYLGAKQAACGAEIVGGDITGADKVYISVTAIGNSSERTISSRSSAQIGQKIVIAGNHGSSAVGLKILQGEIFPALKPQEQQEFIDAHLMPKPQIEFSKYISKNQKKDYAMMDTSDGLADALCKISESSGVLLEVDFEKIPTAPGIIKVPNYENMILYGGEDYGLIATVDNPTGLTVIGEVKEGTGIRINHKNYSRLYSAKELENKLYNHFS